MSKNKRQHRNNFSLTRSIGIAILGVIVVVAAPLDALRAASLSTSSVAVSDPRPSGINTTYSFTGSSVSLSAIKCIKQVYSDTAAGSVVPAGMSTAAANFDTATSNYVPTPAAWTLTRPANGTLTLTNAAGETPASASARKVNFTGITNSSTSDTKFYLRLTTYNNVDCATSPVDNVTVNFILTFGSTLTLNVDTTLSFTVNAVATGQACNGATSTAASTSTTIPFGTVNAAANSVVCQDLQAATNAVNGYTVSTRYTGQPTNSLSQTIAGTSGSNATPAAFPAAGTEAYGYTTNDSTLGTGTPGRFIANQWAAMTTTNAELAYESVGVTSSTYRIGHQVGVSLTTRPGTYVTTVIYTCTPVY